MSTAGNVTKTDYYEVLQVSRTCNDQELKSAYRRLAMQYHPDRNPGDTAAEESFKEASEAYQVLSDPDKRAAYDRYGHAAVNGSSGFGGNPFAGNADFGDIFGDIFGEMFGGGAGGRRNSRAQRGRDLQYPLTLEFVDAVFGKQTEVKFRRMNECGSCHGTGAENGRSPVTCDLCRGRGQVRSQQGFFLIARTCPTCGGAGTIIKDPCKTCHGEARVQGEHTLHVTVPAGVEDGTRIRYQGEGDAGRGGGPAGDFYVLLSVKEHAYFTRDGNDLHYVLPISMPQAALGVELNVPTLDGEAKLKVPEGTQSGKAFRIRNKGVPFLNERGRGDLIVEVAVHTPTKLSKEQRELMRQLSETLAVENAPASHSFFEKMKDIFS
ncbi:MAG TPA: molecular chaperone DnaJ [Acidobacteriaceae bacterium]|nr:molecular chaperone DnaJ [Acidobacteriaceae bacterium]